MGTERSYLSRVGAGAGGGAAFVGVLGDGFGADVGAGAGGGAGFGDHIGCAFGKPAMLPRG